MTENHIFDDLIPAIIKSGCGSQSDWDTVFKVIRSCTSESLVGVFPPGSGSLATAGVFTYREIARASCETQRALAGISIEINENLKGNVCRP